MTSSSPRQPSSQITKYQPTATPPPQQLHDELAGEPHFPKGQCLYILTTPGAKGQRCACVQFNHNLKVPGSTCDCGHQSCFHNRIVEARSPDQNYSHIQILQQKVHRLERTANIQPDAIIVQLTGRVSQLEEAVERNQEDIGADIKGSYRSISGAWQTLAQMQKQMTALETLCRSQSELLHQTGRELLELRNRQLELFDSEELLDERIEKLEEFTDDPYSIARTISRRGSMRCVSPPSSVTSVEEKRRRRSSSILPASASLAAKSNWADKGIGMIGNNIRDTSKPESWTVHISLLPTKRQPYPFEKDTTSYKRCLSRGLHRMLAVTGSDASSFQAAVSNAFADVLQGRDWEPLQARAGETQRSLGTPMLRPLDQDLAKLPLDFEFLRTHCAICDGNGKMTSLYIALTNGELDWETLRALPVHLGGLEAAWADNVSPEGTKSQEIYQSHITSNASRKLATKSTSNKRRASTTSFYAEKLQLDVEGTRRKVLRTCQSRSPEVYRSMWTL